jgi:prepilin-type N-terminal cleavage/methylation domain-containing protein
MKKAFTLLELIFVLVLIGVLSGITFYMNRPDATRGDAQYTLLKLKEARYRSIGFDTGNGTSATSGCVTLTKEALSSNETPTYTIKSNTITSSVTTVCFDALGRPHDGNSTALGTLFRSDLNITFQNNPRTCAIRLYKQSGYAIITCTN